MNAPSAHSQEKLRKLVHRAIGLLRKKTPSIPYCSVNSASPGFSFPEDFLISDYDGLLSCQILKGLSNDCVIAHWSDEAHFSAFQDKFTKAVRVQALISSGAIIDVLHPREPVWKRYPIGSYVLFIAALFGALTAIRDYFGVLFAAPSVGFSYLSPGRLDVVEGAPISVSLAAVSEIRLGQSQAKIESAVMQPELGAANAQSVALEANPRVLPGLVPGQVQNISIDGIAPTLVDFRRPAIYKISVEATVRAGIFRFPSHESVVTRTVWVWPSSPRTSLRLASKNPSGRCEYDGNIYTSGLAPQGTMVKVEILLSSQQPGGVLPRMIVSPPPGVDLSPAVSEPTTIRKREFKSAAISGFQSVAYEVYLEFENPTTDSECRSWLSNLDASADWTKADIQR